MRHVGSVLPALGRPPGARPTSVTAGSRPGVQGGVRAPTWGHAGSENCIGFFSSFLVSKSTVRCLARQLPFMEMFHPPSEFVCQVLVGCDCRTK